MVNLLESMHKCCLPSGIPSQSPSAYEKSLVHRILGGCLRSQVRCSSCSHCSSKFDPFLDLSLEIANAATLVKALQKFTEEELLDGGEKQYNGQSCKKKVVAQKRLTIGKAPKVLTIHLKHFSPFNPGHKINKKVDFQPTLNLKPKLPVKFSPCVWPVKFSPWPSFECSQVWSFWHFNGFVSSNKIIYVDALRQRSCGEKSIIFMVTSKCQVHEAVPGNPLLIKLVGLIPGDERLRDSAVLLQSVGSRGFLQYELLQPWPLPHQENVRYGTIQENKLLELMVALVGLKPWLPWKCFSLEENFSWPDFVTRALCDTSPWDPGDSKIRLWNIMMISQCVTHYEFLALPWDPGHQANNGHKCRASIASAAVICARYILDICDICQLNYTCTRHRWKVAWFSSHTILFCTTGRIFPWGSHQCQWRLGLLSECSAAVMVECSADAYKSRKPFSEAMKFTRTSTAATSVQSGATAFVPLLFTYPRVVGRSSRFWWLVYGTGRDNRHLLKLHELGLELRGADNDVAASSSLDGGVVMRSCPAFFTSPQEVSIHPPNDIRSRGRIKRIKGHGEKGAQKNKKENKNKKKVSQLCKIQAS